jgi:N-acetylmuramoyl-L-alanine amidase
MKTPLVTNCFLDISNTTAIDGTTFGALLSAKSRDHLWDNRPAKVIDTVVVHYISAADRAVDNIYDFGAILKIFCDLTVSSHFLVCRNGNAYRLVPEEMRAWHCGGSIMPAPDCRTGVNDFSIGIELVATHDSGFTAEQYDSCAALIKMIENRIQRKCVLVGHQDIAGDEAVRRGLRSDIKRDPGPQFSWQSISERLSSIS